MRKPRIQMTMILMIVVGVFVSCIGYTIYQVSDVSSTHSVNLIDDTVVQETVDENISETSLCVLEEVNENTQTMIFYDTKKDRTIQLMYTGTTDFRDEYGTIKTAAQFYLGEIVWIVYNETDQKLESLHRTNDSWEYEYVSNLQINRVDHSLVLYDEVYQYDSKLFVHTLEGESSLGALHESDVVTIRGCDQKVLSICVTKGHGSIRFEQSEYFEGASLWMNQKEYILEPNTSYTVAEGTVDVQIQREHETYEMTVVVQANEETEISLSEYTPNPEEQGQITFFIVPKEATLFIDNTLIVHNDAVELTYGEHTIEVMCAGYETYTGSYSLNRSEDIVRIELSSTVTPTTE